MSLPIWTVTATVDDKPIQHVFETVNDTPYQTGMAFGKACGFAYALLESPSTVNIKITFSNPDQLEPTHRANIITLMEYKDGETSLNFIPHAKVVGMYTYNPLDYSLSITAHEPDEPKKLH